MCFRNSTNGEALKRIAVVGGAGRVGIELVEGLMKSRAFSDQNLIVTRRAGKTPERLARLGVKIETDNRRAVSSAEATIICIKPNDVGNLAEELNGLMTGKLLISTVAARSEKWLANLFHTDRVVRVMTDIGASSGCAYTAIFANGKEGGEDANFAAQLFSLVGKTALKSEDELDAHTVVDACMPAFAAEFISLLVNASKADENKQDTARKHAAAFRAAADLMTSEALKLTSSDERIFNSPWYEWLYSNAAKRSFDWATHLMHTIADSAEAVRRYGYRESVIAVAHAFNSTASLILEQGRELEEIKETVASPNGITRGGLDLLKEIGIEKLQEVVDHMVKSVFEKKK